MILRPCDTVTITAGVLRCEDVELALRPWPRDGQYIVVEDLGGQMTLQPKDGGPLVITWRRP